MNVRRSYGPIDAREQGPGGVYDAGGGGGGEDHGGGGSTGGGGEKPAGYAAPAGTPAASPVGGPAGVGGTGGYGFVNLGQYLYANPNTTGQYAPTPAGATASNRKDYSAFTDPQNQQAVQYGATGQYTAGMAGVDNALNSVYGRALQGTPHTQPGGGAPGGAGGGHVEGGPGGGNSHTQGPQGQQRQRGFGALGSYFHGGY